MNADEKNWLNLGPAIDIPVGTHKTVLIEGYPIAVFHLNCGFYAIEDSCTHQGLPLSEGAIVAENHIRCPFHGAEFCIKTGKVLSLPAYIDLKTYPVEIHNDTLYLSKISSVQND